MLFMQYSHLLFSTSIPPVIGILLLLLLSLLLLLLLRILTDCLSQMLLRFSVESPSRAAATPYVDCGARWRPGLMGDIFWFRALSFRGILLWKRCRRKLWKLRLSSWGRIESWCQEQWCKQDQILKNKTKTTGSKQRHLVDLTFK